MYLRGLGSEAGGAAAGAATGAASGAVLGPVGMIVGAAAGVATSYIGASAGKDIAEEQAEAAMKIAAWTNRSNRIISRKQGKVVIDVTKRQTRTTGLFALAVLGGLVAVGIGLGSKGSSR